MLTVTNASHVRIEGLVFESGRGTAVDLENSSNCLIAGCTVRNMSGVGVRINGGQQNSMIGCDLHDLEQGGCYLNGGGDGDSLVPAGHLVANCRFRNFGISRVNSAGIDLGGVGNRIAHCVFEDCPSSAIIFHGNNLRIEYNEFRNCCNENEDYGVIYAWGNPIWRGNIWRFNKFSHCGGGYTQGWVQNRYFGTSAFRFDDAVSGQTVYGNVFTHFDIWGTSAGVMSNNCGRDNIYDNNLVTDSPGMNAGYYNGGNRGRSALRCVRLSRRVSRAGEPLRWQRTKLHLALHRPARPCWRDQCQKQQLCGQRMGWLAVYRQHQHRDRSRIDGWHRGEENHRPDRVLEPRHAGDSRG